MMIESYGNRLREEISHRKIIPFIGVYDVFSASIAARHFDALFMSGFSFAASHYGLPDIGFIAWPDVVGFVQRIRTILPGCHILVDIDDGYCDAEVACHVVTLLEACGASGVVMEDQKRPRRCGHLEGKQILELGEYLLKLEKVLSIRRDLVVVARTDASDPTEIIRRAKAFEEAGADAVLVDGVKDLDLIKLLRDEVKCPLTFNQIKGGKSAPCNLRQLEELGVKLVIYSTPCLFAAQASLEQAMRSLKEHDGDLCAMSPAGVTLGQCNSILSTNLAARREGWTLLLDPAR